MVAVLGVLNITLCGFQSCEPAQNDMPQDSCGLYPTQFGTLELDSITKTYIPGFYHYCSELVFVDNQGNSKTYVAKPDASPTLKIKPLTILLYVATTVKKP